VRPKPSGRFGKALAKARSEAGLTQSQLAEILGIKANTVARWERGERTPPARKDLPLCQEDVFERLAEH
jgi:transcriptional regulator with XRE-family HTH domain